MAEQFVSSSNNCWLVRYATTGVVSQQESGSFGSRRDEVSPSRLMLRIRRGDPDALERLMEQYWTRLVGYASQLLGCLDDANDVAQEVFVRAWTHRHRWQPGGSAEAYLYSIARNLSLLQLRHREVRRRCEPELRSGSGRVQTPVDETLGAELRQAMQAALATLPDRRRQAFLLVRVDGLSLGAAADLMGVTKRTVANHVYMASTDLERTLEIFHR
jgi:RNA polymerase sigma factor (sigma-70 family)